MRLWGRRLDLARRHAIIIASSEKLGAKCLQLGRYAALHRLGRADLGRRAWEPVAGSHAPGNRLHAVGCGLASAWVPASGASRICNRLSDFWRTAFAVTAVG